MVATDPQADVDGCAAVPMGLLGQLIRFALIGGFCALVDLGTYTLLTQVAGMARQLVVAMSSTGSVLVLLDVFTT